MVTTDACDKDRALWEHAEVEDNCFTILCWFLPYESAIDKYMSLPSWTSLPPPSPFHPSGVSQSTQCGALEQIPTGSVLHMVMHMRECYSLDSSRPLVPPLCPEVCSLCLQGSNVSVYFSSIGSL